MKINKELIPSEEPTAVALGSFDGLHIRHRAVISQAVGQPRLKPSVLTFVHNPSCYLLGQCNVELMTEQQKEQVLETFGVQQLYLLRFSSIMNLTAEQFVENILMKVCNAKKVCCGFNFTFGAGGRANSDDLRRLCKEHGLAAAVEPAVMQGGAPVSSTRIRALVRDGRMEEAASLLGRPYGYLSPVKHGKKLGRQLGTPTLNQQVPASFVLPRFGVYASLVYLNGQVYCGVTNVGVRPTVGGHCVSAETWMPDYTGPEVYGETVRTDLLHFIRAEKKFSSVEALGRQIRRDGACAKQYLEKERLQAFA
ncbi:MAG: riboflavin biosynthesis protein RibF [Oscillospiraceae bacterium]|nr:riboflavin biosynthesis protein RibF [Oscillospiraceae bacterium]